MNYLRRTWALIDLDAVEHNIGLVRSLVGGTKIMAVVKADAYGHGDRYISFATERFADWYGVSNIGEALSLRKLGIKKPVLILGATPSEYAKTLKNYDITVTVYSLEYAQELSAVCVNLGIRLNVHVKLDTGMTRLGLHYSAFCDTEAIYKLPGLCVMGIFTHLACSDETGEDAVRYTYRQFQHFMEALSQLEERGINPGIRHCCNSAATLCYPDMYLDMVRPGIILYGVNPTERDVPLVPAMSLKSTVSMVKTVPAGVPVSYGCTYVSGMEKTIATVTIGYADGFSRGFSNSGYMLIKGASAPVVGRVCMDQLMLDVTGIEGVKAGETVTVFGESEGRTLTVNELAGMLGTIGYEIVCLIGRRVPRVYMKDGKEIGMVDYITGMIN